MGMAFVAPRYTIADLDRFPDDGNRYELLGGVLLVTPAPGPPHQVALGRLTMAFSAYLRPSSAAIVISPGVIQADDDTELQPDLLVVPARFADCATWREMADWWLAVEVSGRASRVYDRDFKTDAYLRVGVREVWRVDLRDRVVFVSRPEGPADLPYADRLVWRPAEMVEALALDLRTIFSPRAPSR